ncbi:MAG: TolC family protein, partial [Deltaproteobacteria bacterium]
VIQPLNQLDGTATLSVPLLDFSNFALISAANESRHAVASQGAQTGLDVSRQVAQNYYQLVANMALVEASDKALDVARASLQLTQDLFAAGKSATLDVNRAAAEVERQVQQLTLAQLQVQAVARNLASLTATVPEVAQTPALIDDLQPEAPLASFMGEDADVPGLAAVISMRKVREMQAQAQRLNWVPVLSGAFTERVTNATGFINNRSSVYNAVVNLNWNIGLTTFADIDAANATAATARIEEARTRLAVNDSVFIGWQTVHSNIARSRSARKQQAVSAEAASLAKDRYAAGVATQLDLLQAQRDAFAADVSRIQADADLVNARIQLRLYAGRNPFASTKEVP